MNYLKLFLLSIILIGCKKKTFADKITLVYPKNTEMKIQELNEDMYQFGQNLIYIGKENPEIDVKYFKENIPSPDGLLQKINESNENYEKRITKSKDSTIALMKPFFREVEIMTFSKKKEYVIDSLTDVNFDTIVADFPFDLLSNKNLEIIVKENDTIPLYKKIMGTTEVKTYKAFPIFIKNISSKILKIPETSTTVSLYFQNNEKKFQYLRNSNYMICGTGQEFRYFELKPNEILIYAYSYFNKGIKRKAKVNFYNASSKEFEISIDEKIIKNQRDTHFLQ